MRKGKPILRCVFFVAECHTEAPPTGGSSGNRSRKTLVTSPSGE
jgi:hypothetical protein